MDRYDPLVAPDPSIWLSLDESKRIELVDRYHTPVRAQIPRPVVHACIHVIVENQLAEHVPEVEQTLARMLAEGLDRHEAIHAISYALAGHLNDLAAHWVTAADPNEPYYRALAQLQADQWRTRGQDRVERRALRKQQRQGK
jgi:hypothetical protein